MATAKIFHLQPLGSTRCPHKALFDPSKVTRNLRPSSLNTPNSPHAHRQSSAIAAAKKRKQQPTWGSLSNLLITKEEGLEVCEDMILGRCFEDMCSQMYDRGKIFGYVHLYSGQEAVASGFIKLLKKEDSAVRPTFSVISCLLAEKAQYAARDPIAALEKYMIENNLASEAELKAIEKKIDEVVEDSVEFADASPTPDRSQLLENVFADPRGFGIGPDGEYRCEDPKFSQGTFHV